MEDTRILSENIEDYLDENGNVKEEFKDVKKVFLKDLPRWGKKGRGNEGTINWKESADRKSRVVFIYNGEKGIITINDYKNNEMLEVIFNKKYYYLKSYDFKHSKIGALTTRRVKGYRFSENQVIELKNNRNIKIIEKIKIKRDGGNRKAYKCICMNCNITLEMLENNILKGVGCPVCCDFPQKVIKDKNSIYATHPYLVKYFYDRKVAYNNTFSSNKKVRMICPICKRTKVMVISNLYNQGLSCVCEKGSYPEKFMTSVLEQLNIDFEPQKVFSWSRNILFNGKVGKRIYDFYFEYNSKKYIIETHGSQHYYDKGFCYDKNKYIENKNKDNDDLKRKLAIDNGIDYYIEVDCRISNLNWLKNNIIKSLGKHLDLSNIKWELASTFSLSKKVKEVCDEWNNQVAIKDIAFKYKLDRTTIRNYLKQGNEIGLCLYNKEIAEKSRKYNSKKGTIKSKTKKLTCLNNGKIYEATRYLCDNSIEEFGVRLIDRYIRECCLGKIKHYKGYTFRYLDENGNIIEPNK